MFNILAISDSDKHFSTAIQEYQKRLAKQLKIQDLKPIRADHPDLIIEKETELIISLIQKKYPQHQKILLLKEGESRDTLEFAEQLEQKKTVFILGWPYGLEDLKFKEAFSDLKILSFGAITLPHGLAKLTLLEQLYRSTTIWSGKKYHY